MQAESECMDRDRQRQKNIRFKIHVKCVMNLRYSQANVVELSLYSATTRPLMLHGIGSCFRNLHFTLVSPFYCICH